MFFLLNFFIFNGDGRKLLLTLCKLMAFKVESEVFLIKEEWINIVLEYV